MVVGGYLKGCDQPDKTAETFRPTDNFFPQQCGKTVCDKLSELTDRVISLVDIVFHIKNYSKSCPYCRPSLQIFLFRVFSLFIYLFFLF